MRAVRPILTVAAFVLAATVARPIFGPACAGDGEPLAFTDSFGEDSKDLGPTGRNTYFILEPGYQLVLAGTEKGKAVELTVTVLDQTKTIDGVETRIVEERETKDGKVGEISRNFFAISKRTSNVYYFGEESVDAEGKPLGGDGGTWHSGEKGARYGLFVPATPLLGARYQEENAPGAAMDRGQVISISETRETKAGKFEHVLKIEETSAIEAGEKEYKYFAPGIGLLEDDGLTLVRYGKSDGRKAD